MFNRMLDAVDSMIHAIHHHPFNVELAEGRLPQPKFIFYLEQDALYLAEYSRALALTGVRLSQDSHAKQFLQFALDALDAEKALHRDYLNHQETTQTKMNSACFMYTHYLLAQASVASVEEASASLLPCFWVYREVGKKMLSHAQLENNQYRAWIELYAGVAFDVSVEQMIHIVNHLGEKASFSMQEKMISAFMKSTELEWMFWDAAYHLETWKLSREVSIEFFDQTV